MMVSNGTRVKTGFTLIELLVVIAIIAILASILFPVFSRAREKARQVSCQSNTKSLASACLMYSQDYDERMPAGSRSATLPNGRSTAIRWGGQIQSYVKNLQIFTCPSANRFTYGGASGPTGGYGYNSCFLNNVAQNSISQPAETIMVGDSCGVSPTNPFRIRPDQATAWCGLGNNWRIAAVGPGTPCPLQAQNAPADRSRMAYRHNDFTSIAFIDGHVKAIKYADVNRSATTEDGRSLNAATRFVFWNRF